MAEAYTPPESPQATSLQAAALPQDVKARIERGRKNVEIPKQRWKEAYRFWQGDQYVFRWGKTNLASLSVTSETGGKPPHKVRATRNLLVDIVAQEVAYAMQRTPVYEVVPSTTDPEDVGAAHLSEKVSLYGHDKWGVRRATERAVTYALVQDEGFVWPYFDPTQGAVIDDKIAEGEISLRVYGSEEVFWEPGIQFEESRWHCVEQARDRTETEAMPDFKGPSLKPDAKSGKNLVLITDYLERPSPQQPRGRWLVIADKRIIATRDYPAVDSQGNPLDRPCFHKISYFVDPKSDRDMGLVRHCIDRQRFFNQVFSKISEWVNLTLSPQLDAPIGSIPGEPPDPSDPGAINYYIPVGGQKPTWRQPAPIPRELLDLLAQTKQELAQLTGQQGIPDQVQSGRGIEASIEKEQSRRTAFAARLAEFYGQVMRSCLVLVQRHYSEKRLLKIKGRFGWEFVEDFRGADLSSQVDVSVSPASIEPRTKAAIEQKVLAFADRGWVSPEAAMAAIEGGVGEKLIEDYELDVAWQNHEIQEMIAMVTTHGNVPDARPFDNHQVHLDVLHSWMKTQDFALQPPEVQEAAMNHEAQHQMFLDQAAAKAQAQQVQMAEQMGMANAAKPQSKGTPSQKSPKSVMQPQYDVGGINPAFSNNGNS